MNIGHPSEFIAFLSPVPLSTAWASEEWKGFSHQFAVILFEL